MVLSRLCNPRSKVKFLIFGQFALLIAVLAIGIVILMQLYDFHIFASERYSMGLLQLGLLMFAILMISYSSVHIYNIYYDFINRLKEKEKEKEKDQPKDTDNNKI